MNRKHAALAAITVALVALAHLDGRSRGHADGYALAVQDAAVLEQLKKPCR